MSMTIGTGVTETCPHCGREGEQRFYGDEFTSLQTGFEVWACADWCGEHTHKRFVLERTGDPSGGRRYV